MTGEEIKLKRLSQAIEEDMTENELFEIARERRYRINDLQKENEQLKKYIYRCWHEEEINDYSNHSTNTDSEFKELVNRLKNGSKQDDDI